MTSQREHRTRRRVRPPHRAPPDSPHVAPAGPTGSRFQPVDATDATEVAEVAERKAGLALGEPSDLVPDLAGPKIYTATELVKATSARSASGGR